MEVTHNEVKYRSGFKNQFFHDKTRSWRVIQRPRLRGYRAASAKLRVKIKQLSNCNCNTST